MARFKLTRQELALSRQLQKGVRKRHTKTLIALMEKAYAAQNEFEKIAKIFYGESTTMGRWGYAIERELKNREKPEKTNDRFRRRK